MIVEQTNNTPGVRNFVHKPIVKEMMQWDGTRATMLAIQEWNEPQTVYYRATGDEHGQDVLVLITDDYGSPANAFVGDWVAKDSEGKPYPIRDGVHKATYTAAEQGWAYVARERIRQIDQEGFQPFDDFSTYAAVPENRQLLLEAAIAYALSAAGEELAAQRRWPTLFPSEMFKPKDQFSDTVRSAALQAAHLDVLLATRRLVAYLNPLDDDAVIEQCDLGDTDCEACS